ncbi:MAG: TetR family transcriptional regulator [Chitinivibrionales bacterium]|nr:TetR family transcriptional regulator [Chitinivibrionales bacterium]
MSDARERFITTTSELLETQGYHATGLNQIVKLSKAPRGSLYHYFPGGKEALAAEAVKRAGNLLERRVQEGFRETGNAGTALAAFIRGIAMHVEASEFRAGGPLATVAMETAGNGGDVNRACREAYSHIVAAFEQKLIANGLPQAQAKQMALFAVAAVEGAIVLSRTIHDVEPLRRVAEELERMIG